MTSPVHLFHLLLLFSNPLCQAEAVASAWLPVRIDETWLTQNGTKFGQHNTLSNIICAAVATQAYWSNLFCFQEGNCRFNDVIVPPFFEETQPGNIIDCKARKQDPNASTQGPSANTQGPSATTQGPSATTQGPIATTQGPIATTQGPIATTQGPSASTCPAPYQQVANVGCIMIITSNYNYDDARSRCQQDGGQLATPESFTALVQYLETEVEDSASQQYWVGAQVSTEWHDGRAVDATETAPGEPNGTGDCYRMRGSSNFLLADQRCNFEYRVICEL